MSDADADEVRELAQEIAWRRAAAPMKKWRAPVELRIRVVEYGRRCLVAGEPVVDIAGRLGMVESTLYRWLRRAAAEGRPGLSQVAIVPVADGPIGEVVGGRAAALRLTTPRGYVVEGLDIETVATLLRELG
jgi:transposase-like protein